LPDSVDVLDINVWLPLSVPDHAEQNHARRYWEQESAREVAFTRVTALGFVRLLMNPAVLGEAALGPHAGWQQYLAWREMPGVIFLPEPPSLEERMGEVCATGGFGARGLTDAYLVAFALSAGCRLVSFDGGFRRFAGLNFLHLRP
jgi:toxin-antitoxin system PIN domain toxin